MIPKPSLSSKSSILSSVSSFSRPALLFFPHTTLLFSSCLSTDDHKLASFLLPSGEWQPRGKVVIGSNDTGILKMRPHTSLGATPGLCDSAHTHRVLTTVSDSQHPGSPPAGIYLLWIRGSGASSFHWHFHACSTSQFISEIIWNLMCLL